MNVPDVSQNLTTGVDFMAVISSRPLEGVSESGAAGAVAGLAAAGAATAGLAPVAAAPAVAAPGAPAAGAAGGFGLIGFSTGRRCGGISFHANCTSNWNCLIGRGSVETSVDFTPSLAAG